MRLRDYPALIHRLYYLKLHHKSTVGRNVIGLSYNSARNCLRFSLIDYYDSPPYFPFNHLLIIGMILILYGVKTLLCTVFPPRMTWSEANNAKWSRGQR